MQRPSVIVYASSAEHSACGSHPKAAFVSERKAETTHAGNNRGNAAEGGERNGLLHRGNAARGGESIAVRFCTTHLGGRVAHAVTDEEGRESAGREPIYSGECEEKGGGVSLVRP